MTSADVRPGHRGRSGGGDRLSGGERKTLVIARVLILDEPTANPSPRVADLGKAVLLVEQRARAALEVPNWTRLLVSGLTRLPVPLGELLERPDFEELFLGAGPPVQEVTNK